MRRRQQRVPQATFLGILPGTRRGVGVSLDARVRGSYIVGVTGAGKSTLLLGLMCQDLRAGRGLCLLDPNGDLVDDLCARANGLGRMQDVLLVDLQARDVAFGLNLFACPNPDDPQAVAQTAERVVGVFKKLWGTESWGPRMQDLLANAALTLVANPGTTLADLPRLLTDAPFRQSLTQRVANAVVREYWLREYDRLSEAARHQVYAPLTNKVREFLRNPLLHAIVAQPVNSIDLRSAIECRKIVLVRLDPALEEATNLLGTVFVQQLLEAAFARRDQAHTARFPFMIYADEAHRFATPAFVTLLREARKYGIATTAATQMHSLLPPDVATAFTNSATVICFQLVPEDAKVLQSLFTGSAIPRSPIPVPDPLGTLLRSGHPDSRLVASAKAVERELVRYQAEREYQMRRERRAGYDAPLVTSHMREVRSLIDATLFAAMADRDREPWAALQMVSADAPHLLAIVRNLSERLSAEPLTLGHGERPNIMGALTHLPAFHALVRYRQGTCVTEALVRTLQTRPLRPALPILPLGVPRTPFPILHEDPTASSDPDQSTDDGPPPMFTSH